jgi:homocysteine S-methyltransferase
MQNKTTFEESLARGLPILLDGGLATELEAQGNEIGTKLWSAALLQSNPQAIVSAHRAYLDAGANCLISASYQASSEGFMSLGLSENAANELIASSINLANQARDEFIKDNPYAARSVFVAASVGPYGATLHDGSEYTGNYGISTQALGRFHAPRLRVLDQADPDVLACETIPSMDEAIVLCELLYQTRSSAWISFSCRDGQHISDGTPIREAAALFSNHPKVADIGVNCTPPQFVTSLINHIRAAAPDKVIVAYPNSGETFDAKSNSWSGTVTPIECANAAKEWLRAGAQLIGGCCRMGPSHIAAMADVLGGLDSDGD